MSLGQLRAVYSKGKDLAQGRGFAQRKQLILSHQTEEETQKKQHTMCRVNKKRQAE